jgi:hypothetical protein
MPNSPIERCNNLFSSLIATEEAAVTKQGAAKELAEGLLRAQAMFTHFLPVPDLNLSSEEQDRIGRQRIANVVMGPAATAVMTCVNTCPFRNECSLYQLGKHPVGLPCHGRSISSGSAGWGGSKRWA